MNKGKTLKGRMTAFTYAQAGEVLLRRDFNGLASSRQVSRVISQMVKEGLLYRLGYGLYAKTRSSVLTARMIPRKCLGELAQEVLRRLGVEPTLGYAAKEYAEGRSTQIPAWTTFNTGARRMSRKITVGISTLRYENDFTKKRGVWDAAKRRFV